MNIFRECKDTTFSRQYKIFSCFLRTKLKMHNVLQGYIINSENDAIKQGLKNDVNRFISTGKYELLMEAKDSGEIMRMYTVGTETVVNSFVLFTEDNEESTFICIDGDMNRDDLDKILASQISE